RPRGARALPVLLVRRRDAAARRRLKRGEYHSHFAPTGARMEIALDNRFRAPRTFLAAACAALLIAACGGGGRPDAAGAPDATAAAAAGEVNLYTTREPGLIQPLLDAFTASTGIRVNTVLLKDGLLERLGAEGERSGADVL